MSRYLSGFFSAVCLRAIAFLSHYLEPFSGIALSALDAAFPPDPRAALAVRAAVDQTDREEPSARSRVSAFTARILGRRRQRRHGPPMAAGLASAGLRFAC